MKKKVIKINESILRQIVSESVKKVVKEISIKTLDNAERKSGGWEDYTWLNKNAGYGSELHKAIDTIEENLEYYAYKLNNRQAQELLRYIDPIRNFFNRKGEQARNFTDARENESIAAKEEFEAKAKEMFNKSGNELSEEEFEAVLNNCSPRTQEYAETFYLG